MKPAPALLVWLALVLGVAAEILAARLGWPGVAPFIGIALAVLVALTFMQLGSSTGLVPVFALVGVFWLCVLLGLGGLDAATRTDVPVPQHTPQ